MGSNRAGVMLAKISNGVKNINVKPCGMYEWFDCHLPGCSGFTEYFLAARPRNPQASTSRLDQNASLEAEVLVLTSIPLSYLVRQANSTDSDHTDHNLMNNIF